MLYFHRFSNRVPRSSALTFSLPSFSGKVRGKWAEQVLSISSSGIRKARRTFTTTISLHRSVAIVGSGPSGCYCAKYLSAAIPDVQIDILERLPTPYGLVRSGVAPDHPEVKNVQNDFDTLFIQDDGGGGNIQFFGHVTVGKDVSVQELREMYDAVILSYGCESDKKLGIPGEDDLKGVLSAREFVAWYNGHPDYFHIGDKVKEVLSDPANSTVVVIGQGNVALDCARILTKGAKGLFHTDLAAHALPILQDGVKCAVVLGRRGHIQGAFTIKELRELSKLEAEGYNTTFHVRVDELEKGTTAASLEELKGPRSRPKVRIDKLLRDAAAATHDAGYSKEVALRFLLNPVRFEARSGEPEKLGALVCERTELYGEAGQQRPKGTAEYEKIQADLALVSIGYKGEPLEDILEHFDGVRGVVRNELGRVEKIREDAGGLYVSGWLKRGPSGIIGTNIADAKETVACIIKDMQETEDRDQRRTSRDMLSSVLSERNVKVVDWNCYQAIDRAEKEVGRKRTNRQPREKFVHVQDMIDLIS